MAPAGTSSADPCLSTPRSEIWLTLKSLADRKVFRDGVFQHRPRIAALAGDGTIVALATSSFEPSIATAVPAGGWGRWVREFGISMLLASVLIGVFIVCADPFDTGRLALLHADGATETRAAFAAVSRARDRQFDAAVIGNSRAQLLDPARLSALTRHNFVQLSVPAAHVAEEEAIVSWFLDHHQGTPVILLIVLDDAWCSPGPLTGRPFPFWLFGDTPTYVRHVISPDGLDKAWRRVRLALGLLERARPDGYDDYERVKVWDRRMAALRVAVKPPATDANVGTPIPAAAVLQQLMARADPRSRIVLLWSPVHANALPVPNSAAAERFRNVS